MLLLICCVTDDGKPVCILAFIAMPLCMSCYVACSRLSTQASCYVAIFSLCQDVHTAVVHFMPLCVCRDVAGVNQALLSLVYFLTD